MAVRKYPILADREAVRACLERLSPDEVAQEIGCSVYSVRAAAKALGLMGMLRTWAARRRQRIGTGKHYESDPFDRLEGQRRRLAARQAAAEVATPYGPRPLARIGCGQLSESAEAAAFAASGLGRRARRHPVETMDETGGEK